MSRPFYITAALLCSGVLYAQTPLTTISDTLGGNPSGTAIISWSRYLNDATPRQIFPPGSLTIQITNGVVNVALFPTAVALPTSSCYQISYQWSSGSPPSTRYWFVPVSSTPVALNQIESSIGCTPGIAPIVAPSQINPGPAGSSTVLTSSSTGLVSWLPGGGSGGSPPFSNITGGTNNSGQTLTVGSTSILNYSGTGIVDANQVAGAAVSGVSGNSGRLAESTGTLSSADLASFDASGNVNDSGIPKANAILSTGSYANPAWITAISASIVSGSFGCGVLPALTGDATNSGCAVTVSKTGGVAFAPSATTDATNAANISTGTLAAARLPAINLAASGAGGVTGNLQAGSIGGGAGCSTATWVRGDLSCQTIPSGGTVTNSFGPLAAGRVAVGNGANDLTVLSSLGTSATVLTGNATGTPSWAQVNLATTVSGVLPGANGGTGTQYVTFSGPTSAVTMFLPTASSTVLTSHNAVTLAQGGTGANFSAIALGGILSGTGAGAIGITTLGTNGYVLTANSGAPGGVAWTSPTSGGTVTSIAFSSPLTGGTVTATGTAGCPTCATSAAALTLNQLVIGSGSQGVQTLGSLGATGMFLQGNSGGAPNWSAVNVGTSVTGLLARANGGLNSSTAGTGLLRDGTTPAASEISGDCATSGSNAIVCTKMNGQAVTLGGAFTMSGAFGFTGTLTATTAVTFPTSGTLVNTGVTTLASLSSANGTAIPASATLTQTVCSGTISLSGTVASASSSNFTATCTGLASTDNISLDFNGSPLAITGFVPSASGMLTVLKWPSSNTINVSVANNTAASITLGSTVTLNYHVYR